MKLKQVVQAVKGFLQGMTASLFLTRQRNNRDLALASGKGKMAAAFQTRLAYFPPDGYMLTLNISGEPVVVCKDGSVAIRPHIDRDAKGPARDEQVRALREYESARARIGWHPDLVGEIGAVGCAAVFDNVALPSGLIAVVGGAGAGKTPLAHAIAGLDDGEYSYVAYGEPLSGYITDATTASQALALAFCQGKPIVFDSIKDLLSTAGGGAMKAGLSRGVLPILTQLSIVAADAGVMLLTPINPSSKDAELMETLVEAVSSNTTAMFVHDITAGDKWKFMFRRGEGLERSTGTLVTGRTSEGGMKLMSMSVDEGPDYSAKQKGPASGPTFGASVSSLDDNGVVRAILKSLGK